MVVVVVVVAVSGYIKTLAGGARSIEFTVAAGVVVNH